MEIIRAGGVPYPGYVAECVFGANFANEIPRVCEGQSYGQSGMSIWILQRILSSSYRFKIVKFKQSSNHSAFDSLVKAFGLGTVDMSLDIWRGTFLRSSVVEYYYPVLFSQTMILTSATDNPREVNNFDQP